ncbi:hypothetical protein ACLOJK_031542 [Asimina triloba]
MTPHVCKCGALPKHHGKGIIFPSCCRCRCRRVVPAHDHSPATVRGEIYPLPTAFSRRSDAVKHNAALNLHFPETQISRMAPAAMPLPPIWPPPTFSGILAANQPTLMGKPISESTTRAIAACLPPVRGKPI